MNVTMPEFRKIVVCGVGLIGASFARALRNADAVERVVGVGRSTASLETALELGVIDLATADWAEALKGADLVLLATPVGQMEKIMAAMRDHLEPQTVVTDGGSTKQDVVAAARRALGDRIHQFVPGHPIAGAEKSGVRAADPDLYRDKRVILTPLPENAPAVVEKVRGAWQVCGALVSESSPEEHDAVFAAVSHLPHLLSFALVHELSLRPNAELLFGFAGAGFRDFTRIASSHPEMWRDICLANRDALGAELDAYIAELVALQKLLRAGDGAALEAVFARSRQARDGWLASRTGR